LAASRKPPKISHQYFWRFVLQILVDLLIFGGFGNSSGSVLQFLATTSNCQKQAYFQLIIFGCQIPSKIGHYH
jgi:hypothetical protein